MSSRIFDNNFNAIGLLRGLRPLVEENMLADMNQTLTSSRFDRMPPETLDAFQTISNIWWAERGTMSFDVVRRVLHLLSEVIEEETANGKRVEVELLGTFARSPGGMLMFEHEPMRDWPSMDTYVVSDLQSRLAGDRE